MPKRDASVTPVRPLDPPKQVKFKSTKELDGKKAARKKLAKGSTAK